MDEVVVEENFENFLDFPHGFVEMRNWKVFKKKFCLFVLMDSAEKWLPNVFCIQVEIFAGFLPLHPNIFSFKESGYDIFVLGNDLTQFFKLVFLPQINKHEKQDLSIARAASHILKRKAKSGTKGWQHILSTCHKEFRFTSDLWTLHARTFLSLCNQPWDVWGTWEGVPPPAGFGRCGTYFSRR